MLSRPLPQSGRTGLIAEFDHPVAFDDFPGGTISSRIAGLPPVPISTRQPASFICRACSVTAFLCGAATCRGFGRLLVPLEVDQDDSTASMTLGCTAVTGAVLRGWGASTIAARARFLDVWVGTRRLSRGTTAESGSDGSMPSRAMNATVLHVPLPCLRALLATRALVQASLWPCYRRVERSAGRHRCVSSCKPLSVSIESASRRIFGVHRDITTVRMVPATSSCAPNFGAALHG